MRCEVGLLVRIDVSCEDVEFLIVKSGAVDCYDFLHDATVDPQKIEPDGLTRGL